MARGRPSKRTLVEFMEDNADSTQKIYRFQILLPNGTNVRLILQDPGDEMFVDEFVHAIRKEAEKVPSLQRSKRKVMWDQDIYLEDLFNHKIRKKISFSQFMPNKLHILKLLDGESNCVSTYQNLWDLTPHTDLLQELPAEYTFETALADLIDNSLQAVWSNEPNERRLISVTVNEHTIVIFDSGQGMDGSDENSITKWGKMGSSNHRASRKKAIGYNAPYLMPFFGMFGYGGPIASMHLGKLCIVTSKTKASREACFLKLSREALLNQSTPKCIWRTDGGFREPSEVEMQLSPHGSFTKVEIRDLKLKCLETYKLQCLIKDIYFPYIQFDERDSRKTTMPIEFEVNGTNLAEIHGGEVALTNLRSCNGPDFTFEVKFVLSQHISSHKSFDSTSIREANARLKCVYFPIFEGKENIERIIEKLEKDDCGIKENFDNFARVSVRRLGRLLPDSRWNPLPFMDAKHKRGDKAQLLKRCYKRVKCFIETDAGFSPTPSKTDLAHHDPFTQALKSFNLKPSEKESEMSVVIFKDKKKLSLCQMEKDFKDWVIDMHDKYDEEIVCGEDDPVLVVGLSDKKRLGVTSEVVRVHHVIKRKGTLWKSGQKVKILKGAVGCPNNNNNMYATLEYILIEGFQGDAGGEARLICRPIDSCEKGCELMVDNGNASLEIQESISLPISLIDSGKIQEIDLETWSYQLKRLEDKLPSKIEILTRKLAAQLGIHEELPIKTPVIAGCHPPKEIVAIIRPASFASSGEHDSLDQKFIVKDDFEMTLEIRCATGGKKSPGILVFSESVKSSARNGFHGVYIFCLQQSSSKLFCNAGTYTFYFSTILKGSNIKRLEAQAQVVVKPDLKECRWRFVSDNIGPLNERTLVTRVGSCIPYLSIGCFDSHSNQIPFSSDPQAIIKLHNDGLLPACFLESKRALSSDRLLLEIRDILITNHNLDLIRPSYEVLLDICSKDSQFSAAVPCKVLPGPVSCVKIQGSSNFDESLAPGDVIEELMLEMLDAYGNHIEEGEEVSIQVDGFNFVDNGGSTRKVNSEGRIELTRALKVVSSFGSHVSFSVFAAHEKIFEKVLQVMKRELRVVSEVDTNFVAGSRLENVIFEVSCPDGVVDVNIHGLCHTLTIHSEIIRMDDIQYTFHYGRCTVPVVPIPQEPGPFCFVAFHTHFPELQTSVMVHVIPSPKLDMADVTSLHPGLPYSPFHDDEVLIFQNTPQNEPSGIRPLVAYINNDAQKLEEKLKQIALGIKASENKLKTLEDRKKEIEQETHVLEASIDPQYDEQLKLIANTRENIQKQVEGKDNTAAAVFCHLSKAMQIQEPQVCDDHFMSDVVGVVALLGTVCDIRLSRIFAELLGESNMLAIVCKSYKSALRLEKYRDDGETDYQSALHMEAKRLSISISKRFTVFCLDEIKKFPGPIKDDPQRSLIFPKPNLKGRVPVGFLGRAVNMINLDTDHLNIKTSAGYGLRETLLYKLFGNVHVYRTWNDMLEAHPVIKNEGAVSLDGGIMRDRETILFGRNCDPDIIFPVSGPTVPENVVQMIRLKNEKKHQLESIDQDTERELKVYADVKAKFYRTKAKLSQLLSKMESLQDNMS